jgi:hypothetical protein
MQRSNTAPVHVSVAVGEALALVGAPVYVLTLPLKLVSEANARGHWRGKDDRVGAQRLAVAHELRRLYGNAPPALPLGVHVVRIAPRALDRADNLPTSCKAALDGVCDWLAINDRSPQLFVSYGQERAGVREYAVRIEITPQATCCPQCVGRGWVAT